MRFRTTCLALLLSSVGLGACRPSGAERFARPWTPFLNGEGIYGAYDAERLRRRGDTVDVWLRFQYDEPQSMPGDAGRTFVVTEVAQTLHCPSARTRDVRMLVRGAAGDSLSGFTAPAPQWLAFAEHPLTDQVLVRLCDAIE